MGDHERRYLGTRVVLDEVGNENSREQWLKRLGSWEQRVEVREEDCNVRGQVSGKKIWVERLCGTRTLVGSG